MRLAPCFGGGAYLAVALVGRLGTLGIFLEIGFFLDHAGQERGRDAMPVRGAKQLRAEGDHDVRRGFERVQPFGLRDAILHIGLREGGLRSTGFKEQEC